MIDEYKVLRGGGDLLRGLGHHDLDAYLGKHNSNAMQWAVRMRRPLRRRRGAVASIASRRHVDGVAGISSERAPSRGAWAGGEIR